MPSLTVTAWGWQWIINSSLYVVSLWSLRLPFILAISAIPFSNTLMARPGHTRSKLLDRNIHIARLSRGAKVARNTLGKSRCQRIYRTICLEILNCLSARVFLRLFMSYNFVNRQLPQKPRHFRMWFSIVNCKSGWSVGASSFFAERELRHFRLIHRSILKYSFMSQILVFRHSITSEVLTTV